MRPIRGAPWQHELLIFPDGAVYHVPPAIWGWSSDRDRRDRRPAATRQPRHAGEPRDLSQNWVMAVNIPEPFDPGHLDVGDGHVLRVERRPAPTSVA